jgi:hypothetical protein
MDSTLFAKIVEAVNAAEDTELHGRTKKVIVQYAVQKLLGREEYRRYAPMIDIAIDAIVDRRTREIEYLAHIRRLEASVVEVLPKHISRRRSFLAYLCCL